MIDIPHDAVVVAVILAETNLYIEGNMQTFWQKKPSTKHRVHIHRSDTRFKED